MALTPTEVRAKGMSGREKGRGMILLRSALPFSCVLNMLVWTPTAIPLLPWSLYHHLGPVLPSPVGFLQFPFSSCSNDPLGWNHSRNFSWGIPSVLPTCLILGMLVPENASAPSTPLAVLWQSCGFLKLSSPSSMAEFLVSCAARQPHSPTEVVLFEPNSLALIGYIREHRALSLA